MDVKEAIYARRAVRDYTDEPVSEQVVRKLIDAAIQAPSGMNRQTWAFVVVQDLDLLKSLSDRNLEIMRQGPNAAKIESLVGNKEYNSFYNAGTLILICAKPEGERAAWDCCLAGENLMLAARAMGLGTCPIGFSWPVFGEREIKEQLGIPENYEAVLPIIVGWPKAFPPGAERNPPEILSWKVAVHS